MEKKIANVEKNFVGMDASFLETTLNHEASDFITENVNELVRQARKMGDVDPDLAQDLVHDVWLSIRKDEENGEGYDASTYSNEGDYITVKEFVFGRIKRYSMNSKYHNRASEYHKTSKGEVIIQSASCDSDREIEDMDGFQKALATATTSDNDIDTVDLSVSLRENIEYCLGFNDMVGFDILNLFKNLNTIEVSKVSSGIFDALRKTAEIHDEFKAAFVDVINTSMKNRGLFDKVVASF